MRNCRTLLVLVVVALVLTVVGIVQVKAQIRSYSLGAGAGLIPDYEGSDDYKAVPIPFANVVWDNNMYVELLGLKVKANLLPHEIFRIGPVVNYRRGRDDVDDKKVDDLDDVDDSIEMGAFAGIETVNWHLTIEGLRDVSDGHEGALLTIKGGYTWMLSDRLNLSLGGFTTYADEDYMSSYFGIDGKDSGRSGLDTFNADAGWKDVGLSIFSGYRFADNWTVRGGVKYTRLLGDAEDSPVTEDRGSENQFLAGAIVVYTFGKAKAVHTGEVEPYKF